MPDAIDTMPVITSRANARVKRIAALHDRPQRDADCLFWAEGRKCVEAAIASGWRIDEIAVDAQARQTMQPLLRAAQESGCPVVAYDSICFGKFSALRHPDGIGAVIGKPAPPPLPAAADAAALVLWGLQDPGNQGSIIRSAAAMGCRTVITVDPCVDAFHPLCVRATAGQIFNAAIIATNDAAVRSWLAPRAERTAVLTADGSVALHQAAGRGIRVLVIGGEARGVPEDLRSRFLSVSIPMGPQVESLNVNAAAAIALYALWGGRESLCAANRR